MFDTIAVSIIGLSILYSVWKGMVKEAFSLIALVFAYLMASNFYTELAGLMAGVITEETLAHILSFIILFLASLLGMAMLGRVVGKFLRSTDTISGWDRILGGMFGMAKGVLILMVFMLPLQWFDETYANWTEDSVVAPYLEGWVEDLRENVGPGFTRSLPGSLRGLRKQVPGFREIKEQVTDQKEQIEEKMSALSEGDHLPQEHYTDEDREELDSILQQIEDDHKNSDE